MRLNATLAEAFSDAEEELTAVRRVANQYRSTFCPPVQWVLIPKLPKSTGLCLPDWSALLLPGCRRAGKLPTCLSNSCQTGSKDEKLLTSASGSPLADHFSSLISFSSESAERSDALLYICRRTHAAQRHN
jgi:hypothetical protein